MAAAHRQSQRAGALVPALIAGAVTGTVVVILSLSFAVLIFAGKLSPYMGTAIGMVMFTGIVVGALVAVFSSYPGSIAFPQDKIAPILALMASLIVAEAPAAATPEQIFPTVMMALMLATLLTGLVLFCLGAYQLGGLIRFMPYPVMGGFLAGTGWLLVKGSLKVTTGQAITLDNVGFLFQGPVLVKWLPALLFAVVLVAGMRRWRHVATMPILLAVGIGLFHVVRLGLGVSAAEIEAGGFVLGHLPAEAAWRPTALFAAADADWPAVAEQAGTIATVLMISAIGVLLNSSGLEVAANQDIDLNRELKIAGLANIASGLGGGIIGFHTLGLSSLVLKMGVKSRVVGLVSSAMCAVMLVVGTEPLALFPKAVLGGLLMYIGFNFLIEWLYDGRRRMSSGDYLVVIMIVAIVGSFGYLQGAAAGIVACVVLFVVNYSRVDVAKHELTGADVSSNVDRPRRDSRLLADHGRRILVFTLQGFMFFGTANKLLNRVMARVDTALPDEPARFVLFDFRRVTGIDSSAGMSFAKMRQFAEKRGLVLVFAQLPDEVAAVMRQAGFLSDHGLTYRMLPDLDYALEWCEDEVLREVSAQAGGPPQGLMTEMERELGAQGVADHLAAHFERLEFGAGTVLLREGDDSDELYLLESGRVTVQIAGDNGKPIRLRSMQSGTVVGEMGLYLGIRRSASVVADEPCVCYRLSQAGLERMQTTAPAVAALFHREMARRLADRLRHTDLMVKALTA
ncbi:MAG: SulP family inorganic anion transporter [Actinomycetota bacterium]